MFYSLRGQVISSKKSLTQGIILTTLVSMHLIMKHFKFLSSIIFFFFCQTENYEKVSKKILTCILTKENLKTNVSDANQKGLGKCTV